MTDNIGDRAALKVIGIAVDCLRLAARRYSEELTADERAWLQVVASKPIGEREIDWLLAQAAKRGP